MLLTYGTGQRSDPSPDCTCWGRQTRLPRASVCCVLWPGRPLPPPKRAIRSDTEDQVQKSKRKKEKRTASPLCLINHRAGRLTCALFSNCLGGNPGVWTDCLGLDLCEDTEWPWALFHFDKLYPRYMKFHTGSWLRRKTSTLHPIPTNSHTLDHF